MANNSSDSSLFRFLSQSEVKSETFDAHAKRVNRQLGIVIALCISILVAAMWPTDYFVFGEGTHASAVLFQWRVMMLSVTVVTALAISFLSWPKNHPIMTLTGAGAALGIACGKMVSELGGLEHYLSYMCYLVPLISVPLLVSLRARILPTLLPTALFILTILYLHPHQLYADQLITMVVTVVTAGIMSLLLGQYFLHTSREAFLRNEALKQQSEALREAQETSERLLLNVLPPTIADRLRGGEETIADSFDDVSVLFADIVGFTKLSAKLPATEMVATLGQLFRDFDALVEELGLEKIKTIGDAYMVAAGIPTANPNHALDMAELAVRMLETISETPDLDIRIGIASGPAVAGVIGKKRFIYDLWGHTVNMASRMESQGRMGNIQCTGETADLIRDQFTLAERGNLYVKGAGFVRTWFIQGRSGGTLSSPGIIMDEEDRVSLLRSVPLFSEIPIDQLHPLAHVMKWHDHKPGEVLMREGEAGDTLYLIASGQGQVLKAGVVCTQLGPREPVGEMALLSEDQHPRSATVRALTATRCLVMERKDFLRCLELTPALSKGVIRVLIRRLRNDSMA